MSTTHEGVALPSGWLVYETEDGRPYFHNSVAGITQWDNPGYADDTETSSTMMSLEGETTGGGVLASAMGVFNDDPSEMLNLDRLPSDARLSIVGGVDITDKSGGKKGYGAVPTTPSAFPEGGGGSQMGGERAISGGQSGSNGAPPQSEGQGDSKFLYIFDVKMFQTYFNVSTSSVIDRMTQSLLPFRMHSGSSNSDMRKSPDVYGPFWICATLVVVLFAMTNSSRFVEGKLIETNYVSFVVAFFMVYGYLAIVPLIGWGVLLFLGPNSARNSITLLQLLCIFGYSFTVGLPLALICVVPSAVVRWLFAAVAAGLSIFFMGLNFKEDLYDNSDPKFKLALCALFGVAQLSFHSTFPLYFFR